MSEHLLVVCVADLSKDSLVKTQQMRSFSAAFVEHPGDYGQMTSREHPENQEQPLRVDVCPVHTDLPPPLSTEPAKPRGVYIGNSVELVRYGNTPGWICCEAAVTQEPLRDHTEQCGRESSKPCLQMLTSVHGSGKRMKECHVQSLMRNQT